MKKLYFLFAILMSVSVSGQVLVLNEAYFDPASGLAGDANADGTRDAAEDEFLEFVNNSGGVLDISGYKIYDATQFAMLPGTDTPNHIVPAATMLPDNGVYLVFGGGTLGTYGSSIVHASTSGNLNLTNGGDEITVTDASDTVILTFDSDALFLNMNMDQSAMRNPNITGNFTHHRAVDGTLFSPGVLATSTFTNSTALVVNELHFDPAGDITGDANGDSVRDAKEDEFIELVNNSGSPIDISGFKFFDNTSFASDTPRHIVAASTIIPANGVYLLFGGGTPTGSFGGAIVETASTSDLSLNNGGDIIFIKNASDVVVLVFDSPETGVNMSSDQSVTRNPDITGDFVLHTDANAALLFSPGKSVNDTTLSTNQFETNRFSIYPNPTTDSYVNIKSNDSDTIKVAVFDILGKQISNTTLTNGRLNISELNSGLYILKISQNNTTISKKLIVEWD